MSGPSSSQAAGQQADDQDGSMDSILASIRRIIMEDEAGVSAAKETRTLDDQDDELLVLKPSMMVERGDKEAETMEAHPPGCSAQTAAEFAPSLLDRDPESAKPQPAPASGFDAPPNTPADRSLLAPEARIAAALSLASLQEAVRTDVEPAASLPIFRSSGPTLEDMVRDELRGQLKLWLDAHLPTMVERLVRQEIERLVRPA